MAEKPQWTNAAAYWLRGDPGVFLDEVFRRAGSGEWQLSDTLEPQQTLMVIAEALTPRVLSEVSSDAEPQDRLIYIVLTNSTPGDDDTFNHWYSHTHIPDVLKIPGFTAAQRFRLVPHPRLGTYPYAYAAFYEVRASEATAAFADLRARAGSEAMVLSPTLVTDGLHEVSFEPLGISDGTG